MNVLFSSVLFVILMLYLYIVFFGGIPRNQVNICFQDLHKGLSDHPKMKYDPTSRKNPPQCDPECEKDRLARVEAEQREQDRKDIPVWSQRGASGNLRYIETRQILCACSSKMGNSPQIAGDYCAESVPEMLVNDSVLGIIGNILLRNPR